MAKALSEEVRLEIDILRELNSLRGSGFELRSVTTVTTCCLHVLRLVRASAKLLERSKREVHGP